MTGQMESGMAKRVVRIGGASGFWGDTSLAAPQLLRGARLDYLVFDYLAEVTMSIMAQARARSPEAGYATDFVRVTMTPLLRELKDKGVRVISNAGGVNPLACRDALRRAAKEAGVELKIGVVLGDGLADRADELRGRGVVEMFSGAAFPTDALSVNAYLGARPIADALAAGCDVVITGRCVDSAVTLGPLMHEFGWSDGDYDLLAAGTLCGHVIECGPQCTGGLFTDWREVGSWTNIGYPVAEVEADGAFTVAKPAGTDGLVSFGTVAEQILYELHDPAAYLVPDVTADFRAVRVEEVGRDRVRVSGARGRPPTSSYKVSATHLDGWRNTCFLVIGGFDAAAKARRTGETVLARTREMLRARNLGDYRETRIEALGAEDMYGAHAEGRTREVVLKIAARHDRKEALEILAREFAPAGVSMAPGTAGVGGGRPAPAPVVRLFSFLLDKAEVPVELDIDGERRPVAVAPGGGSEAAPAVAAVAARGAEGATVEVPLIRLAWARSGDKGDTANVGVVARRPEYLPLLRDWLTEARVKAWFVHHCRGRVERFDLPGFGAMNYVLRETLGGGGMASLHTDNLAKAYAQVLLSMPTPAPKAWFAGEAQSGSR